MLTLIEKILFALIAVGVTGYALWKADQIRRVIMRGHGTPDLSNLPRRLFTAIEVFITQRTVFKRRFLVSLAHAFVAWGFTFYLLVNLGDVLYGYIPNFVFMGEGLIGNIYRLLADLLTVGVLVGMLALLLRRFAFQTPDFNIRESTLVHPKARAGRNRDSLIVGIFILIHVGARFFGESFLIAQHGPDAWQPFATLLSAAWGGLPLAAQDIGWHVSWWLALGMILAFVPYFPHSKHIHLFFAPINYLTRPDRKSMGQLDHINFEDESLEQFGATRLEDLSWTQLVDAYACIMCNRCQDACPAYTTGKVLSPAALEINKRYFINQEFDRLAKGEASSQTLLEFAITPEAVWACTACGACVEVCPVGNEPMRDILDIRRSLVLMESEFPAQWQTAFRGMERSQNPWNVGRPERLKWAEGLNVPTIDANPDADILWWVGCAPATDARAQKTARAFAEVLNNAGVNFAVLGRDEACTGDSARRAGNDALFFELATGNVELLNTVMEDKPRRIVTTCPHCLHTIKNEYPDFGGNYQVVHHTQLLSELVGAGKITLDLAKTETVTFHDPCYLGRQNGVVQEPRDVLAKTGLQLIEMPLSREASFCCGAGGAQMWKEEEHGDTGVNTARYEQARASGAKTLAVGCPFCMVMLNDANSNAGEAMQVKDVAEIVAESMHKPTA